jgi:autotransporter-associated beta strand protein
LAIRAHEEGNFTLESGIARCLPFLSSNVIARHFLRRSFAALLLLGTARAAEAALTFWVDPNGWPDQARRDAAVYAAQVIVDEFNRYGEFAWANPGEIRVVYGAGTPTADAGYGGWGGQIRFGGSWPSLYVMLHEANHWLGSGTFSAANGLSHNGPAAVAMIEQFDGVGARINTDGVHFWPYGHNQPNEYSPINHRRNVALMYALRQDWGIGPWTAPSSATEAHLLGNDPAGESGFNFPWNWSNDHFAQAGTHYYTGDFAMRTPNGYPSWNFRGESLTVNNKNNPNGGLLFNGWGTTGVVGFKNLIVDGGTVKHDQFPQDLFQLGGKVTLVSTATFNAANGDIKVLANIGGSGSLRKTGGYALTVAGVADYTGDTVISEGTLRLMPVSPVASYTFDAAGRGGTVPNTGTGGTSMNGTLMNGATIVPGGQFGNAVSLTGGASVDINNPIIDLGSAGHWTISAWVKTTTPGGSLLTKGDGIGWSEGNTIFYLGDGAAGGSGGIPSAVRWGGGFFQGASRSAAVNNNEWHHVTYINNGGDYKLYVDGVAQPLSPGNEGFANADIGSFVRLGVSTNTFPGDGTVNFNGLLDDVHFYSHALSAAKVEALYQATNTFAPLPSATNVTIASGATLDVNNVSQQIGSLSGRGGAVTLGSGRLIVSSSADSHFGGTISGAGGSLVKQGAGTLTLGGANNYTGTTTVSAGTLRVDGGIDAASTVTVSGGTLAGTGTVAGLVTVNGGAHIAPGASIESLDVGSLTLAAGSILDFELNTVGGVDLSDLINVTNTNGLTVNCGILNLTNAGSMTGGTYTLIDYLGAISGSVSNIVLGVVSGGFNYSLVNNTLATSIDLLVSPQLLGDYNNDGQVNAADYTVWRNYVGQPAGTLLNDNTGVAIGSQQFALWKSNYGNVPGGGSVLESEAVPEPAGLALVMIGICATMMAPTGRVARRVECQ